MTERIPYARKEFKGNFSIHQEWRIFDGPHGCTPLAIDGFGLRMDRLPPPLPVSVPPPDPTMAPPSHSQHPAHVEASKGFKGWLEKAAARPAPPSTPEKGPVLVEAFKEIKEWVNASNANDKPKAQPFDMLDIPQGMAAMGFSKGRILAERWFNGRAFVGPTSKEEKAGSVYPREMKDDKTINMTWLLGFDAVKDKYDELINILVYSVNARREITNSIEKFLIKNPRFQGNLQTKKFCGEDLQKLHHQFQFQFNSISDLDTLKNFAPTDLTASLGSFNLMAAIASMDIATNVYNRYHIPNKTLHCTKSRAVITHVWVYAKDSYSFQDDEKSSQYLGHWSKNGLIVLPIAAAAGKLGSMLKNKNIPEIGDWDVVSVGPHGTMSGSSRAEIYTSIRNRNYVEWRNKHGRGGDFVIYSNLQKIELDHPIHLDLEEVCS